jgi:hypothetical protein
MRHNTAPKRVAGSDKDSVASCQINDVRTFTERRRRVPCLVLLAAETCILSGRLCYSVAYTMYTCAC